MIRTAIAAALLLGAGSIVGTPNVPAATATRVVGTALARMPATREEGTQAVDDATAAALIGAISSQFERRKVEVQLGRIDVAPAGFVQRDLSGNGRLRIGGDTDWLPFHFHTLYDTEQATVESPRLTLGSSQPGALLAQRSPMVRRLDAELSRRFHEEFASQPSRIAVGAVHSLPAGDHYLQLQARGSAHFGREGQADADIHALYDTRTGDWLQLDYVLGDRG